MSTASPSRGIRSKTSEFTDFFRGAGHSSLQTRQSHNDISTTSTPAMALEVPSSCDEGASVPKKKITRIPLFGRSRKKSNQSSNSSPFASSGGGRYSSEGGELSSASRGPSTDRNRIRHPAEPLISVQPPPLPTTNKHNSSLTSKFAARFSHSRSSKAAASDADSASVKPAAQSRSSGLQPPGTRSSSIESGSSNGTKSRSATPRPAPQPTITISLTADDYDEYKDLFSRPGNETPTTVRGPKQLEGALASTSTRPSEGPSTYRRGQTPAAAIAAAVRHQHTSSINGSEQPPSPPPKNSKSSSDRKGHESSDGGSTPRAYNSVRESSRPSELEMEKGLPPSLQRRASVAVGSTQFPEHTSISSRSRMKQPSSPSRSKPPSIPLPLPPTPPLPSSLPPNSPSSPATRHPKTDSISSFASSRVDGSSRPRAVTISSGVNPSRPSSRLSRSAGIKPPTPPAPPLAPEKEGFNIETASADALRQALMERNLQYDELATFVLKMTEAHVAEVTGLEKKISNYEKKVASLESEVLKQEKTIQGMIHIINDQDEKHQQQGQEHKSHPPSAILNTSRLAARGAESDQESPKSGPSAIRRRLNYHSDSGAESHATSAGSGTDSLSSIFRNKKLRRPYPLGDSAYVASRTGSLLRSSKIPPATGPPEKNLPDVPSSSNTKRASITSMSPSPSSSASSLLPPSPSVTMSSLSAIPEGLAPSLRPRNGGSEPADDRRTTTYSSNRASTSSMTSSSTAASSSYSANIKRSRPPSIAQVLEKSPKMDNVLDKLRPFS
ncbi:hypothetical protein BDN70DRAFT_916833 [Pholiota conissans]|uniref:Uncharacterized protein n=1 Tax=Pholiota conissans TaxID=109636 RepID=A0A9P5ZFZ4_9AGAR|nr:hypothetical protein BDN70DRAFT_916833 [Pholiota conissans]